MSNLIINNRQKNFWVLFSTWRVPSCINNIFSDLDQSIDLQVAYMQRFLDLKDDDAGHKWLLEKVLIPIRQQGVLLRGERMNEYLFACYKYLVTYSADLGLIAQPFSSKPGDVEQAIKAWQAVLSTVITDPLVFDPASMTGLLFIQTLITQQVHTHSWDNLLLGLQKGNKAAQRIMTQLISLFGLFTKRMLFVHNKTTEVQWMLDPTRQDDVLLEFFAPPKDPMTIEPTLIPVPRNFVFAANRFYQYLAEKKSKRINDFLDLLSWFGTHEDYFQEITQEFWKDIMTDPKYGLHPKGDLVTVQVTPLRNDGYRSLQLIPTEEFSKIKAGIWIQEEFLGTRVVKYITLTPGQELKQIYTDDNPKSVTAMVDKVQQFMTINAFWKIVTGKVFKAKTKNTTQTRKQQAELRRSFQLRPHFRWLPATHTMTDRAAERSLETFHYLPPQGKTFVKSDSDLMILDESRSPVFSYTDEDLGYEK